MLPAKLYITIRYRLMKGYWLDLSNPITFNEKLQWLKLYYHRPEFIKMVDKYEVKEFVSSMIGGDCVIPTLGVWDKVEDIDFSKLPTQFVLKCTHDSGGLVICKERSNLDIEKAKKKLKNSLKTNYYHEGKEWPYKYVKPRIIAEAYMEDKETKELRDYKFFCFAGNPYIVQCDFGRFTHHKRNVYDINWNLLDLQIHYPSDHKIILVKPKSFEKMIDAARILSKDIPFARIDFYEVDGKMYFGEITFYHGSGLENFYPKDWDKKLGDLIILPNN